MRLEELHKTHRDKYRKLSLNDFLAILINLGEWTWLKLPAGMQYQLLNPHKVFTRREKNRLLIQKRLEKIAENVKIDSVLWLGLPTPVKDRIRTEAALHKMRMSPYVREKLGLSEGVGEKLRT